jgi:hypothetical protein
MHPVQGRVNQRMILIVLVILGSNHLTTSSSVAILSTSDSKYFELAYLMQKLAQKKTKNSSSKLFS